MVDSADQFLAELPEGFENALRRALAQEHGDGLALRRYQINVLVASAEQPSGPVVYEDNPTYANLIGRFDHEAQFGALTAARSRTSSAEARCLCAQ